MTWLKAQLLMFPAGEPEDLMPAAQLMKGELKELPSMHQQMD
jgi:hypothetical protein